MIKRTFLLVASVLALAAGVAACGGGSGEETTASATVTDENVDAPAPAEENIVALAQETPDLSTLVEAVEATARS
jgi:ABC-type glycerol-3-phosphate transport system substrate-binding protein